MVVPYGDPNEPHYRKNAFNAGEDGLGKNAHSLKKVLDLHICSHVFVLFDILFFWLDYHLYKVKLCCYRDVIVWATSNILMLTLQISLVEWKPLKIVYVCMKRIMGFSGSIKTGELAWQKSGGLEDFQFLLYAQWPTMSTHFFGTFIRQVVFHPFKG
jgi:hypothetical protein